MSAPTIDRPVPPPPSRCPSCGIVEVTAVCRWCGCWKFGAQGVDAAFRSILAGEFWKVPLGAAHSPFAGGAPFYSRRWP